MTLFIVRHGRTQANAGGLLLGRADPGLDDVGRTQAALIAAALPTSARVVSSPLQRCVETAQAIVSGGPSEAASGPEIDERLIELDYGEFDLRPVKDITPETWAQWRSDLDFRPPGGESFNELGARVSAVLDDLAADAVDGDVVAVTHVSPVKAALAWALGVGVEISWRSFVAQASITRIGVTDRGPSLQCFNSEAHLAEGRL